jgi:hypothetical protein
MRRCNSPNKGRRFKVLTGTNMLMCSSGKRGNAVRLLASVRTVRTQLLGARFSQRVTPTGS